MSSEKKQDPRVVEVTDVPCEDCKWVKLRKIRWQDQTGRDRVWETAERSTRKGEIDAVAMVALLHHPNKPTSIVIEEQFRPPINNVCIELPAGLVDEGESAEQAALRELKEETGYGGDGPGAGKVEVVEVTPLLVSDPGLTSANMRLVILNVHLSADDPEPEPKLDEGEFIVKRVVPLTELWPLLKDYDKKGYTLDARLSHWAFGWHMGHSSGFTK